MPEIPTPDALGRRPTQIRQKPIASAGDGGLGAATENFGQSMFAVGAKIQDREDKMNLAKARARFTQGMIEVESSFDQDNDYKTYGPRYQEKMQKLKGEASAMISNGGMRESFSLDADTEMFRGYDRLSQKAWGKERQTGAASLDEVLTLGRENALRAGDDATAMKSIQMMHETIDAAKDNNYIDATQAQKLKQNTAIDYATAKAGMLPPNARIKALESNKLFGVIPADKKAEMLETAKSELMAQEFQGVRIRNMQRQELSIQAYNDIQAGKQLSEIPYLSSLDIGQQEGLRRVYADKYSDKHIKTDYNEYLNVVDVYTNPARRKEAEDFDITTIKNIEPKKVDKLIDLRSRFLNKEDTSKDAKLLSDTKAADNAIFTVTGKKPGGSDFGDEERKVADAFYRVMDREMNAWLDENPGAKSVPSDVRDGIIDRMTMNAKKEGALWGQNEFNPFKELIDEEGLTPATIDSIAAGLRASGTPVNSVEIWKLYQLRKQEIK